jgi:SAM-dependent methyltransferase
MTASDGADPRGGSRIVDLTLRDYEERADEFWAGTRDHDVSQNVAALLAHIDGGPPFEILDLGCGPGRDLRTFAALGHRATGLDGAARFAAMARDWSGCEVWQQDFLRLDLPAARFDGVFANASLQHVPSRELPRVLGELRRALKVGGILFSSIPHGSDEAGWNRGRYGVYHRPATWHAYGLAAGFVAITCYFRPPGLPRDRQTWLATVWRKPCP